MPRELVRPAHQQPEAEESLRAAMRAALAGDFAALDGMELDYLNVLVRIGELVMRHQGDGRQHWWFDSYPVPPRAGYAPFVFAIRRGFCANGGCALEWCLAEKCRRCDGRLRHQDCRVCGGRWHLAEINDEPVYTDLTGVLLEEQP